MKYIISFLLLIFHLNATAQEALSLERCLSSAVENHPRISDSQLLRDISSNSLMNINTKWKPSVNLNGQISYQSDVIEIGNDISIPGLSFPSPQKDQYKLYLELQQTIYDGGRIKQQKVIEAISLESELKRNEIEIEKVKADIIEIYYNILQLQENMKIQTIMMDLLKSKEQLIVSGIQNGVMMESDLNLLEIEVLEMEQEMRTAELRKEALLSVLSDKCNLEIDHEINLGDNISSLDDSEMKRKEIDFLQNQQDLLTATIGIKEKNRLPLLYGFGQFGYGNPGLNMLNDQFDTYYYVGAGLKWNLWDWKDSKRDKESLVYRSELIDNQKQEFQKNISNALVNQRAVINSYEEGVKSLNQLVEKRAAIVKTYDSQLTEGIIRTIDYLMVVNQEKMARVKLVNEHISLQKAIANYNFIKGDL